MDIREAGSRTSTADRAASLMPGFRTPDAVVIGGGATGLVVAHELTARGLGVVVLEAGAWHQPQSDYTGDETTMLHPIDGRWRWGPADPSRPPWPRTLDGVAFAPQIAAVGGLDVAGWGARPRAFVGAIEDGWPIAYADLVPWYERVEELLPVRIPQRLAPKDQAFVDACTRLGLSHFEGADVDRVGWRLQPSAILPIASREPGLDDAYPAIDGCTACGGCLAGCRNPEHAPMERTAMRNAAVAFATRAWETGRLDVRTGCVATELVHDAGADGRRVVRAVRYRSPDGTIVEQDGDTFVACLGAVETPRLVSSSGLGSVTTGRGLTCHWLDVVFGVLSEPVDPSLGAVSMARCDFPGYGSVFPLGLSPLLTGLALALGDPVSVGSGPWSSSGSVLGSALKRRLDAWPRTLAIGISVDDRSRARNAVLLDRAVEDENGPAPTIRYDPDDDAVRRRDWLARRAGEILAAAGADPATIHRSDLLPTLVHAHGTMRMGLDPDSSVTAPDGRLHLAENLFVADTSVFPNAIGGADPALTAQANAARVAAIVAGEAGTPAS